MPYGWVDVYLLYLYVIIMHFAEHHVAPSLNGSNNARATESVRISEVIDIRSSQTSTPLPPHRYHDEGAAGGRIYYNIIYFIILRCVRTRSFSEN